MGPPRLEGISRTGYSKAGVDFNRWEGEAWSKTRKTGNGIVDVMVLISRRKGICNQHTDWCNNRRDHGLGNGDDPLFVRTFRPGVGILLRSEVLTTELSINSRSSYKLLDPSTH